jgi:predicted DNA binding CopG/RHH family protein
MTTDKTAMVSRSLRLHKSTLDVLKQEADKTGVGITVYIRMILESFVQNIVNSNQAVHLPEEFLDKE